MIPHGNDFPQGDSADRSFLAVNNGEFISAMGDQDGERTARVCISGKSETVGAGNTVSRCHELLDGNQTELPKHIFGAEKGTHERVRRMGEQIKRID